MGQDGANMGFQMRVCPGLIGWVVVAGMIVKVKQLHYCNTVAIKTLFRECFFRVEIEADFVKTH